MRRVCSWLMPLACLSLAVPGACAGEDAKKPPEEAPKVADGPNFAKLLEELRSEDAKVREAGAKALLKALAGPIKKIGRGFLPRLAAELDSADAAVREAAAKSLAANVDSIRKGNGRSTEASFNKAVERLNSKDPKDAEAMQLTLAATLDQMVATSVVEKLLDGLASTDATVNAAAVKKLKELGPDAAGGLVSALEDERVAVRKAAVDLLKEMGAQAKDVVGDLAFLLDNDDKGVRKLAASVLEALGPNAADAAEDMVQYLDNEDKSVRRLAVNILKKMGPAAKDQAPDLVELLNGEDKAVRALAQEVLVNMGPAAQAVGNALVDIISAPADNDADTRMRAAAVIGAMGPEAKAAADTLRKFQNDPNQGVKDAYADAIRKIEGQPEGKVDPKAESKVGAKAEEKEQPKPETKVEPKVEAK